MQTFYKVSGSMVNNMQNKSRKMTKQLLLDSTPIKDEKTDIKNKKKEQSKKRQIMPPTNDVSLPMYLLFWMVIIYSALNMLIKY